MGEGVGMGTRVSSTPGLRSFTPSQRSGPHSAHVGAWYRQTGGSNGNGPSTENNPSFWRLSTDRHCRSPRSGSTGTRMEAALESFTIVTTVTSPALADTHHHRKPAIIDSHRFDDWFDPDSPVPRLVELVREPYTPAPTRRVLSAPGSIPTGTTVPTSWGARTELALSWPGAEIGVNCRNQ